MSDPFFWLLLAVTATIIGILCLFFGILDGGGFGILFGICCFSAAAVSTVVGRRLGEKE